MPGRPPWSQPGTNGGGQTVAVQNRPSLVDKELDQTSAVAPGDSQRTELYAPPGSVYRVVSMELEVAAPDGATTGSHRFDLRPMDKVNTLKGKSDATANGVRWTSSHWFTADEFAWPPDDAAALSAMQELQATETQPLVISYLNNSDAQQTNNRKITFIIEEMSY